MVAPCYRLGHLQMRKAGHHPIGTGSGLCEESAHQILDPRYRRIALIAHPEPEIQSHLIVARPRRMQTASRFADDFLQPGFHVHVNVFQIDAKGELSCFNL